MKCLENDKILKTALIENKVDIFHSCQKCNAIFTSQEELLKHLIFHENYTCHHCNLE